MFDLHFRPTRDEKTGALRYRRPTLSELVRGATIDVPTYANEAVATTLAPLLRSLLALDATTRATASAALASPYFVQPLGATIGARDAAKDRRECIVAYEQFWRDEGVECDGGHFLSRDALVDYVRTLARDAVGKHNGFVRCPAHQVRDIVEWKKMILIKNVEKWGTVQTSIRRSVVGATLVERRLCGVCAHATRRIGSRTATTI